MAANVLNSERAVQASVQVVRAFLKLRQMLASNAELAYVLKALESKYDPVQSSFRCHSSAYDSASIETEANRFPPQSVEEVASRNAAGVNL
jgi:superfamily II helicase